MKTLIKTLLRESLLTEENIEDFFKFLAKDPNNKSMASVSYTAPVRVNKFMLDTEGNKVPNPMLNKLHKNTRFMFRWQDTYKNAMDRVNPEHVMGQRSGIYDKVTGFEVLEMGKSGLYLPIIPTGSESTYSVLGEDGNWSPISKDEAFRYMPPPRPSSGGVVPIRQLIVDRIFKIKSGGNEWVNPHFKYKYLGL